MSYYRGDYYRGDYYRGDPGILGSLAKGIMKFGAGLVPGGGLITTGIEMLGKERAVQKGGQRVGPFQLPAGIRLPGLGAGLPRVPLEQIPRLRKRRRMNPANARALRRAIRREQSFLKLAKRALKGTGISISRRTFGRGRAKRR